MGYESQRFLKHLSERIAEKTNEAISNTANFVRTKFSFSLLRMTILCIRGSRSMKRRTTNLDEIDFSVANHEAGINTTDN